MFIIKANTLFVVDTTRLDWRNVTVWMIYSISESVLPQLYKCTNNTSAVRSMKENKLDQQLEMTLETLAHYGVTICLL